LGGVSTSGNDIVDAPLYSSEYGQPAPRPAQKQAGQRFGKTHVPARRSMKPVLEIGETSRLIKGEIYVHARNAPCKLI